MLYNLIIRKDYDKHTHSNENIYDVTYLYNGGFSPNEDPADYILRHMTIKAVRIA
jgi:hypothetical protein